LNWIKKAMISEKRKEKESKERKRKKKRNFLIFQVPFEDSPLVDPSANSFQSFVQRT